ncbi:unnamed protein product [Malus baccata var. baccata]
MPEASRVIPYGVLFLLLLLSTFISTNHACKEADHNSLLSSFDTSSSRLNWSSSDCCHWEGIACDADGRHEVFWELTGFRVHRNSEVKRVAHESNPMMGDPLGSSRVSSQKQNRENVVGAQSGQYCATAVERARNHAWNLSSLNVSNNHFTGQIPSSICLRSSSLRVLDFSHNNFSSPIPPGLGNCSELEVFRAGDSTLSGSLSADIYNAQALQEISLSTNGFVGPISKNVGKLSKLKLMRLQYNNLEGHLPPSLMNCTNLVEINLGFNRFSGNISALDFSKLTQLSKLDCVSNNLIGTWPISLYSCKSLKALRLAANDFEGQIQSEILQVKNLTFLSLGNSRRTNVTGAMKILTGFKSLKVLLLTKNFKGEEMPDGDITVDSGLQNLCVFSLFSCHMTGHIPAWISKLRKLEVLDLSFNRLTGTIPRWLGTLPHLFFLLLNYNLISGEFPKELCRLQALVSQKAANETDHCSLELPLYFQGGNNVTDLASRYKYLPNMPRLN